MTRDGALLSEATYRMNWAKRDQWKQAQDDLTQAVLNEAIDDECTRHAMLCQRLDEIAKLENVRRIRVRHNTS